MKKKLLFFAWLGVLVIYLLVWPVPIDPQPWQAPPNPGYTGVFARNERLTGIEQLPIGTPHGPEEVIVDAQKRIYASSREGWCSIEKVT